MKNFYKLILLGIILAIGSNTKAMDAPHDPIKEHAEVFLNALNQATTELKLKYRTPPIVNNITQKKKLSLSGFINLKNLPSEIGKLTNLTYLNLCNTKISTLPDEIERLNSLQMLNLSEIQLPILPPVICKLTSLTNLQLSYNSLENIPDEINQLSNLTILNLSYNEFKNIPHGICTLKNLSNLNLCCNKITTIPDEIGNLKELEKLFILNNAENIQLPEIMKFPKTKIYAVHDLKSNSIDNDPIPNNFGNQDNIEKLFVLAPEDAESSKLVYVPRLKICGVYIGQAALSLNTEGVGIMKVIASEDEKSYRVVYRQL